jgi:hypothetical protein
MTGSGHLQCEFVLCLRWGSVSGVYEECVQRGSSGLKRQHIWVSRGYRGNVSCLQSEDFVVWEGSVLKRQMLEGQVAQW